MDDWMAKGVTVVQKYFEWKLLFSLYRNRLQVWWKCGEIEDLDSNQLYQHMQIIYHPISVPFKKFVFENNSPPQNLRFGGLSLQKSYRNNNTLYSDSSIANSLLQFFCQLVTQFLFLCMYIYIQFCLFSLNWMKVVYIMVLQP